MTIRYALKRRDIWDAYWFTWRNGPKLKVAQLFIAGCAFFVTLSWLARRGSSSPRHVAIALAVAVLSILWLPVYPLLKYKPQLRTLTIGPGGIVTNIGELFGEVSWSEIGRIESSGNRLYIVRKTGNSFAIPAEAFVSPEERDHFTAQVHSWWRASSAA